MFVWVFFVSRTEASSKIRPDKRKETPLKSFFTDFFEQHKLYFSFPYQARDNQRLRDVISLSVCCNN